MTQTKHKRSRGRPRLAPRVAQLVVKLPMPMLRQLDSAAINGLQSRSEIVRSILARALRAA